MSSKQYKETFYKPGDVIMREGLPSHGLYVVKEGYVEIFKVTNKGDKVLVSIVKPGEYLGEMSILSDKVHNATAAAITHVTCLMISLPAIEQQLKEVPSWLTGMAKGLIYRLDRMNEMMKRNKIVDESLMELLETIKKNHNNKSA